MKEKLLTKSGIKTYIHRAIWRLRNCFSSDKAAQEIDAGKRANGELLNGSIIRTKNRKNGQENIATRAGQDSKRIGVGIIAVLDKVLSLIGRAVFDKTGKKSKNGRKWPKIQFLRLS